MLQEAGLASNPAHIGEANGQGIGEVLSCVGGVIMNDQYQT